MQVLEEQEAVVVVPETVLLGLADHLEEDLELPGLAAALRRVVAAHLTYMPRQDWPFFQNSRQRLQ